MASSRPAPAHLPPGAGHPYTDTAESDRRMAIAALIAEAEDPTQCTDPVSGWHLTEWACEFLGTSALMIGCLSGVFLDFEAHSPVGAVLPSVSGRLLLTGVIVAATGVLISVSPIGRRSGAHLNPAVSVAFWRRGHMHKHDVIGYLTAQATGAVAGTAAAGALWDRRSTALDLGVTQPSVLDAAAIEAAMTCVLILSILIMVSSAKIARFSAFVAWSEVAILVWIGGRWTGTSLNPVRSLGPALLAHDCTSLWAYMVGPLTGSVIAVTAFDHLLPLQTLTAKLFHDSRYPSTMGTRLAPSSTESVLRARYGSWRCGRFQCHLGKCDAPSHAGRVRAREGTRLP